MKYVRVEKRKMTSAKLNEDQIRYVAQLAYLDLTEEEIQLYARQLNDILGYMEKLSKIDVSQIEPTFHSLSVQNVFREDIVKPSLIAQEALSNAPQKELDNFKVPRILPPV